MSWVRERHRAAVFSYFAECMTQRAFLELNDRYFSFAFHPHLIQAATEAFINADTINMDQTGFHLKSFVKPHV